MSPPPQANRLRELPSSLAYAYLAASIAGFVALAVLLALLHGTPVVDDAYISLIYARNLAHGHGLTYTDGVRVEGYTNFAWVAFAAAFYRAGVEPVLGLRIIGAAAGVSLCACAWIWSETFSAVSRRARIAPLLVGVAPPVAFWALGGLETVLFAALTFAGLLVTARATSWRALACAGALFAAAVLTRPDAVLFYAVAFVFVALRRSNAVALASFAASFALPVAVYWVWRTAYFGDALPNTYYAKQGGSPVQMLAGVRYIARAFGVWLPIAAVGLVAPFGFGSMLFRRAEMRLLAAASAAWVSYVVWIGGDQLLMERMLVPLIAPLAIMVQEAAPFALRSRGSRRHGLRLGVLSFVALIVVGAVVLQQVFDVMIERREGRIDATRVRVGRWLHERAATDDSIAVTAAGAIPFESDLPAIDMLGLNDRHIARDGQVDDGAPAGHQRYDAAYVLARQPAFIFMSSIDEDGQTLEAASALPAIRALLEDPAFGQHYVRVRLAGIDRQEVTFVRTDRAAALAASGEVEFVR